MARSLGLVKRFFRRSRDKERRKRVPPEVESILREEQRTRRAEVQLRDVFDYLSYSLFGRVSGALVRAFNLDRTLRAAALNIHPKLYAARALMYTLVATLASIVFSTLLTLLIPSAIAVIASIIATFIVAIAVFTYFLIYPSTKVSSRSRSVDHELPFMVAYMTVMAHAGVPPEKVIEHLAETRVFKAVRVECQRIVRDIRVFAEDPLSAVDRNAMDHPSQLYKDFMLGLTATYRTGGDVRHYLEIKSSELFAKKMEEVRRLAEKIGLFVNVFLSLNLVLALSLYAFFVVSSFIAVGGYGVGTFALFVLVVQPSLSAMILLLVDSSLPRDPVWDKTLYGYPIISTAFGLAVAFSLFIALGGLEALRSVRPTVADFYEIVVPLVAGLSTVSAGGIKAWIDKRKRERDLIRQLANFLRDLAEVRKTGLSIERCLQYLSTRNYGVLTPMIKRIAGSIALGMDVGEAIRRALRGSRNWMLLVSFKLLIDAIEYGGASPTVLDLIARFVSEIVSVNEELQRRLRAFMAIPYVGAMLLSSTSIMLLGLLAQAAVTVLGASYTAPATVGGLSVRLAITPRDLFLISVAAAVGSTINSWIMGIMSGKLRDQTILSGFLHALFLAIISTAVAAISFNLYVAPIITR